MAQGLAREYRAVVEEVADLRGDRGRVAHFLSAIAHPGRLADTAGYAPEIPLETQAASCSRRPTSLERLRLAIEAQRERLADASLRRRIREDVAEGIDQTQREMLLRRQLAAIRKELGEGEDERRRRVGDPHRRVRHARGRPRSRPSASCGRLERQPEGPEAGMIRTYLEWMLSLPWDTRSEEHLDVADAREVLDADHAGLDEVKERILEYLAVRRLRRERGMDEGRSGVILTLVGPPGTGKTSLGRSVARALGREFARISLGGIRDEAEIRGHRRTYVGALPGRLVRALREAGTMNPVIMLDEVDKVGADWRGDPSSALLEVLDPAQNDTFRDHYLDVELDLSQVLFIATANVADTIPGPLLDRMEVIALDGYTEDEKLAIARGYLIPRQTERNGLHEGEVELTDDAVRSVIAEYTREAGVRNLERELGKVLRKAARRVAEGGEARTGRSRSAPTTCRTPSGGRGSTTRRPSARRPRAWPPASRSPAPAATCSSSRPAPWRPRARASAWSSPASSATSCASRPGSPCRGRARTPARSASTRRRCRAARSTCTCRPARSPRTARRRASRWSRRCRRWPPGARCGRTWA